ncbi:signal recognition particle, SRP19 subunit [Tricharina praecox]|uniref:signal recognition particle, SRP19 subunit n=1 Tax=Tricharina praecox TaxID=43433 RepID=UPI00221EC9D3|nr:signal recognition particle, SRP19 subunit [Tricharina praecox]KAI5853913.1 signal recognition particle, SRP19 subunit [Tricharina praecox]
MSRHARIEEIEDSDPEEVDISSLDAPDLPIAGSTFQPGRHIVPPTPSSSVPRRAPSAPSAPSSAPLSSSSLLSPDLLSNPAAFLSPGQTPYLPASAAADYKSFHCVYPVYFDSTRTRAQGRRVAASKAVASPLAREIADACGALGLQTVFEPGKTHPKDWCNPGRVRVQLEGAGRNKFSLLDAISAYLRTHPTVPSTPLKLRIPNVPYDGKPPPAPIVPRGWKMGAILPLHSPALPGPGVSDDVFKDMMEDMMGGMMGGAGGAGGGGAQAAQAAQAMAALGAAQQPAGQGEKREKKEKKKGKR